MDDLNPFHERMMTARGPDDTTLDVYVRCNYRDNDPHDDGTLEVCFVTSLSHFSVIGLDPKEVRRLAKFILSESKEIEHVKAERKIRQTTGGPDEA